MPIGKLSALQERVLRQLADVEPRWTLTGGAALAGFHTQHRATRDLDLFFRPQAALGTSVSTVREHLERDGLNVAVLRTSSSISWPIRPRSPSRLERSRWARP